jgi:hypothetical protein
LKSFTPGLNGITFPFLKSEKVLAAALILEMVRFKTLQKKISDILKMGKPFSFQTWRCS